MVMLKLRYLIISQMAWRQCYGGNECACYAICTDEESADMTTGYILMHIKSQNEADASP